MSPAELDAPRRLLHPAALGPGVVLALGIMGLASFQTFVAVYVDEIGIDNAAPVFMLTAGLMLGMRIFGARLGDRFGARPLAGWGLVIAAGGLLVTATWAAPAGLYIGAA